MADISKITVNEITYDIKDAKARQSNEELTASLGNLAFKDSASGTVTPTGTVSAPNINVSPTSASVNSVSNKGTLSTWSANVSEETLSFNFKQGSLPTVSAVTVLTGIADAVASAPVFKGTESTITVS